ncbi:MAG TPA: hypothetical protein VFP68_16355 [Burkholderiaceae bacterium]|nr:hypothetical protein [Burkholderiaceae bacterium]
MNAAPDQAGVEDADIEAMIQELMAHPSELQFLAHAEISGLQMTTPDEGRPEGAQREDEQDGTAQQAPTPASPLSQLAEELRTRMPRDEDNNESLLAWARRIHGADKRVQELPFKNRISVLNKATGAKRLREQPQLRDTDEKTARSAEDVRMRLPRRPSEGPTAWALRIFQSDAQVRALPEKERISALAVVTGAKASTLATQPRLRDTDPKTQETVNDIRMRVPRRVLDNEKDIPWAIRIFRLDESVRALPEKERIRILAAVTGAREADLRAQPVLHDRNPGFENLVQNIRMQTPRQDDEPALAWARRIHATNAQFQALSYEEKIYLLSFVTEVRSNNLRREAALRETDPAMVRLTQNVRMSIPNLGREKGMEWARRIYAISAEVKGLPHDKRIRLLSAITKVKEDELRADPRLGATDPTTMAGPSQATREAGS